MTRSPRRAVPKDLAATFSAPSLTTPVAPAMIIITVMMMMRMAMIRMMIIIGMTTRIPIVSKEALNTFVDGDQIERELM